MTKKKIAKEIIILFGCVLTIGLTWLIFFGINEFRKNKSANVQKEISILTNKIDSIKSTFPKEKSFQDLIVDKIPKEINYVPTYEEVMGTQIEKEKVINIRQLYSLLISSKFSFPNYGQDRIPPFLKTKTIENGVVVEKPLFEVVNEDGLPIYNPHFKIFNDSIQAEMQNDTINLDALSSSKTHLKIIYDFLVSKKKLTASIQEFVLTLNGIALPPAHSTWTTYQTLKKSKEDLGVQLNNTNSKIYTSKELTDIAKWICIIVLTIVYPFRFLYLLLKWSVQTLKQKQN